MPSGIPTGMISIIVLGASGDLAKKKTFPALFNLYRHGFLQNCHIIGYARSELSHATFLDRMTSHLRLQQNDPKEAHVLNGFLRCCTYVQGAYDDDADYQKLNERLLLEIKGQKEALRIFYLALPPSVFVDAASGLRKHLYDVSVPCRLVVEKPFGRDLASSNALAERLGALFSESEIYRIDHYLGKEMVKNVLILRFANTFFDALWNRSHIANVQITFKEKLGVDGRGGYFDAYGIIRDVMQNHLLQLLSLIAMESPASLGAEDIRNEKVKALEAIRPLGVNDVVLGQYTASADGSMPGYRDDPTVASESLTPTFAAAVFHAQNERWKGVPFIVKCGKALNEQKAEVRIQLKDVPNTLFPAQELARNELVIRVQPNEAVYMKLMVKQPGLTFGTCISELDLSYVDRYAQVRIPDAYEALILGLLKGDHANFVRKDELTVAWRIFTPLLHVLEEQKIVPEDYEAGTRGPAKVDAWIQDVGYHRSEKAYTWRSSNKL